MKPQWTWIESRIPKGKRLVLSMPGLRLQSAAIDPALAERKITVDCWKALLLDTHARIKDGKMPASVTQLDAETFIVPGLL